MDGMSGDVESKVADVRGTPLADLAGQGAKFGSAI
jgi:hypothetical protein